MYHGAGIGFTVALFVATVAFDPGPLQDASKMRALAGFADGVVQVRPRLRLVLGLEQMADRAAATEELPSAPRAGDEDVHGHLPAAADRNVRAGAGIPAGQAGRGPAVGDWRGLGGGSIDNGDRGGNGAQAMIQRLSLVQNVHAVLHVWLGLHLPPHVGQLGVTVTEPP